MSLHLEDILKLRGNIFKNIDIRAVICRKTKHEPWKFGLMKILLTCRDKQEIELEHKTTLDDLNPQTNDNVKLVAECRSYRSFNQLITELESDDITLCSERIKCEFVTKISNLRANTYGDSFVTNSNYKNHWSFFVPFDKYSWKEAEDIGFDADKIDVQFASLYKWFNISEDDWKTISLKVIIIIPIQIKRVTKVFLPSDKEIRYFVNESFMEDVVPKITLKSQTRDIINLNMRDINYKLNFENDASGTIMSIILDQSVPNDIIWMEVYFKSLIFNTKIMTDRIDTERKQKVHELDFDEGLHEESDYIHKSNNYHITVIQKMGDIISNNKKSNIINKSTNSPITTIEEGHGKQLSQSVQVLIKAIEDFHIENKTDLNKLKEELVIELARNKPDHAKAESILSRIMKYAPLVGLANIVMQYLPK